MTTMVAAKLNGEHDIVVPEHRVAQYSVEGGWEKHRLRVLRAEVELQVRDGRKPVVYYAGAEEGEMPALCQIWGADVVLFEPSVGMWPNMRAIWDANRLQAPLVSVVGFASDHTDTRPRHPATLRTGAWRGWPPDLVADVKVGNGFKELHDEADAYAQVAIDDVQTAFNVPPATIISVDCEGSDWQVLKGAVFTMATRKPTLFISIHPEFMWRMWGQYSRDFRNWIIGFGYEEQLLDWQHEAHFLYTPKGA